MATARDDEPQEVAAAEAPTPWLPTPKRYSAKHLLLLALFSVLFAGAINWPVVRHLTTDMPNSSANLHLYAPRARPQNRFLGDPLFLAWEVAWDGHAVVRQPLHVFDANILWPLRHSLAFSDAVLGYTPAGLIGSGPRAAIVRYNVLFLFSYALAFAGAYLLATELGAGWEGGAVAGAAFAFNSWRLAQNGHLHVLSSGGIPLALFLLVRGWRNRRPWQLLAGWLVATWQLSIGFTLGIPFAYLLAVLIALAIGYWLVRRRPPIGRAVVIASALGVAVFLAWGLVQASPYLKVVKEFPSAKRTLRATTRFSPPPIGYLAAPTESLAWGYLTKGQRDRLRAPEEQTMFAGLSIALLALWGAGGSRHRRALRLGLLVGTVAFGVLALGFQFFHGDFGYRFLWLHAPGWDSSRTPGRLVTFALLGLALLGGLGAQDLLRRLRARTSSHRPQVAVVASILVGAVLFEGAGSVPHPTIPSMPAALSVARPPLLELPSDPAHDQIAMSWSTQGFPLMVNGQTSFIPCLLARVRRIVRSFPDPTSIAILRSIGVNTVVLHTDLAAGTPWAETVDRPTEGLGIGRREFGNEIVYSLGDRPPGRSGLDLGPCAPRPG